MIVRRRDGFGRPAVPLATLGWPLTAAAAAAVVVRVARAVATLPPAPAEPALVRSAYGQFTGHAWPVSDPGLTITGLQVRMYTAFTGAFNRGPSVLAAAREVSVVATAVLVLGLVVAAAVLRVRPLVIAIGPASLALCGPVVTLLTPVGPGVIAAAWLALPAAGAAAALRRNFRWLPAGAIALVAGVATAPVLIIPIGVGAAAWFAVGPGGRRLVSAAVVLVLTGTLAVALWPTGTLLVPAGELDRAARLALLGMIAAAAAGGLVDARLRPVGVGLLAGTGLALAAGPRADALLPALLLTAMILVAVLVELAVGRVAAGPAAPIAVPGPVKPAVGRAEPGLAVVGPAKPVIGRVAAGLAAVLAVAGSVAGLALHPATWRPPEHAALASWVAGSVESGVKLAAPPDLWPDLQRDLFRAGLPDGTLREAPPGSAVRPDELLVALEPDRPSGIELARFGDVAVLLTNPDTGYAAPGERVAAGAQLAGNPRLRASEPVLAELRAGRVDLRAMAVLAAMCGSHEVTVTQTRNPAHESASPMPHRILVLSEVDGKPVAAGAPVLDWLRAQEPPFAPADFKLTPGGLTLTWRLPARLDKSPS